MSAGRTLTASTLHRRRRSCSPFAWACRSSSPLTRSCSPAGSSATMRCTHGSSTPRGSVIPGTRSAAPPPPDVVKKTPTGRWLLLFHQIPPKPDYFRVKVWRGLQRIGAVPVKNSVWVLPYNDQAVEDFRWLLEEIEAGGGEGAVCRGDFGDGLTGRGRRGLFRKAGERRAVGRARAARRTGR